METVTAYCYICNEVIEVIYPEGYFDEVKAVYERSDIADPDLPCHSDIQPVTCSKQECIERYENLADPVFQNPIEKVSYIQEGEQVRYAGPFLEYRKTRPEFHVEGEDLSTITPAHEYQRNGVRRLEPLVQEWLFFGLIQEFLRENYHREDFITSDRILNINVLSFKSRVWMASIFRNANDSEREFVRLDACLSVVRTLLPRIAAIENTDLQQQFDRKLLCMIASLAEVLSYGLEFLFPKREVPQGYNIFTTKTRQEALTDCQWCKLDASDYGSPAGYNTLIQSAFFSQIRRPALSTAHEHCTESECVFQKPDEKWKMESTHHQEGCKCREIQLNNEQLDRMYTMLDLQQIPLIHVRKDLARDDYDLNLVEKTPHTRYVAISHIWAQGLGNSYANGLRRCQIDRIYKCVVALERSLEGDQQILIWIDTLCCPVVPADCFEKSEIEAIRSLRKRAIELMRVTYGDAACVLVLDTELEATKLRNMPVLEVAARCILSFWTRRLWTLQEGVLGKQLWIQFETQAINLKSINFALRDRHRRGDIGVHTLASTMLITLTSLRQFARETNPVNFIFFLVSALEKRSTTRLTDEPICIATLLKLDLRIILDAPEVQRMQRLWDLISAAGVLRRAILFASGPKLSQPGYRWALCSFLQLRSLDVGDPDNQVVTSSARGLQITSAGFLISIEEHSERDDGITVDAREDGKVDVFFHRMPDGRWLTVQPVTHLQVNRHFGPDRPRPSASGDRLSNLHGEYALLPYAPQKFLNHDLRDGALIVTVLSHGHEIECTPICLVGVQYVDQSQNILLEALFWFKKEWMSNSMTRELKEAAKSADEAVSSKAENDLGLWKMLILENMLRGSPDLRIAASTYVKRMNYDPTEANCVKILILQLGYLQGCAEVTNDLPDTQSWLVT